MEEKINWEKKMRTIVNRKISNLIFTFLLIWVSASSMSNTFAGEGYKNQTVVETNRMLENEEIFILDVRTDVEYAQSHLEDSTLIPLIVLSERSHELKRNQKILVYCYKGGRSKTACEYLASKDFKNLYNMLGGIDAWIEAGYKVIK